MKSLNKALSLFLCIIFVLNMVPVAQGTGASSDNSAIVPYTVPVLSEEYESNYVTIYEHEGKFFMALGDIAEFTRCDLTEDSEKLTLMQGVRDVVINKDTAEMVASTVAEQGKIPLLEHNGEYLCEAIPMLTYLGAVCSVREGKTLEVLMPLYTFWEAIMPDYMDYCFDINTLYGGEDNVKISLIFDIISDIMDSINGHGFRGNYDLYMEDALYEVLNVDMMKYSSVKQSITDDNKKINDFLSSEALGTIVDTGSKVYDTAYELLNYYCRFYTSGKCDALASAIIKTDDLDEAAKLTAELQKQISDQAKAKKDLSTAKNAKSLISIGMLAFDTAMTSYQLMQYDDDTRYLFSRTINDDIFERSNYYGVNWKTAADKISTTLESNAAIITHTAVDKITNFVLDEMGKKGAEGVISFFTTNANIYATGVEIGLHLASLINYNRHQAYSADMNAILLNKAQNDVVRMLTLLFAGEAQKFHLSNTDNLVRVKDMLTLYYRFVIAFSENLAASLELDGGKDRQKWIDWFSSTEPGSVANYAAVYLYRITNCTIVPIVSYSELTDQVLTPENIVKLSESVDIDFGNLVSDAAVETVLYDDDWCYCYHIPQFNLSGDHAQQINRKMVDHCDDLLDQYVYPSVRDYGYAEIEQMIYDWGYHRDLASVVLMSVNMWGGAEYDVYTISTSTGQEVAVDTLLAAYGLDLESFHELVHTRLQQYWDERSDWREDTGTEFFDDRVDRTLSDKNIRSAVPYINSEGGLSFVANIYSLAGGDSYYHRINAKGPIEAASMQCTKDHRSNSSSKDDPLQYFIENCSSRYFEKEEIQSFDLQMCMYARNAIFARVGRKFQNEELRTYFEQYSWYQPHIEPEDFQDSMLSAIELANVNLILEYEQTLKADSQIPSSIQTTEQALQAYGDVLDMFHAGISSGWKNRDGEGWGVPRDPDDVSYLFYAYLSDYTLTQIGYAFLDLNGDGNLELLVAPMDLQDKGEFYELYTVAGGKLVHAVSAGERDRYYAAVDGSINNHGSGSALTSADDNLHLNPADGSLKVNQAVIYDAYRDRLNPYFYAETDYYDPKTYETDYSVLKSISEEEAKRIEDALPDNRVITWVPFAQYAGR